MAVSVVALRQDTCARQLMQRFAGSSSGAPGSTDSGRSVAAAAAVLLLLLLVALVAAPRTRARLCSRDTPAEEEEARQQRGGV